MQRQVVALHLEARRRQVIHGTRASVDGEHAVALRAMEMVVVVVLVAVGVVVVRTGGFVAGGLARQVDAGHHAQLLQRVELAVDGGQVQRGDLLLRQRAQLGGGQRAGAALQGLQERVALAGLAFTGFHVAHANAKAFATMVRRKKPRDGQADSGPAAACRARSGVARQSAQRGATCPSTAPPRTN